MATESHGTGINVMETASGTISRSCGFNLPSRTNTEKNGERVVVHANSRLQEDFGSAVIPKSEPGILDPHTGVIYATTGKGNGCI